MATLIAGNLISLADQSFESGIGDWYAGSGASGVGTSTAHAFDGANALTVTSNVTSGNCTAVLGNVQTAVTPGVWYQFSYYIWSPVATSCATEIDWYKSGAYNTFTSNGSLGLPNITLPASAWSLVTLIAQCPATITTCVQLCIPQCTATSQIFYIDYVYFGPQQIPVSGFRQSQAVKRAAFY